MIHEIAIWRPPFIWRFFRRYRDAAILEALREGRMWTVTELADETKLDAWLCADLDRLAVAGVVKAFWWPPKSGPTHKRVRLYSLVSEK